MSHKRIIKKYANRRLYDTEESRYVTLKDIKKIIALGVDVSIIDDTKDVDITRPLLLQIVSEQELGGTPLLNEAVLNQLIRFYGHPMQNMMSGFIANSIKTFISQQEAMQKQMQSFIEVSPFNNFQEMAAKNMQAMADIQQQFFNRNISTEKKSENDDPPS
ncbi:MAG: polyhydroxyalkanoate synthesis repressor PhaR [Candidatus Endobugula sp.]|jgi:polyhydroxyalkanoate synthesis repressor PhaR